MEHTVLYKVRYHTNALEVYNWCQENCGGEFYPGHDWENWDVGNTNQIIQFTDERDASLFALVWT